MSSSPASLTPVPTNVTATATAAAAKLSSPPISIGLAIGLVLGPVFFLLLIAGFWRVARKGDVFPQPPTAALQNEAAARRRDLAKFMACGTSTHATPASGSGGVLPLLPLYTPPAHSPPVYTPAPPVLPAYDLATRGGTGGRLSDGPALLPSTLYCTQ